MDSNTLIIGWIVLTVVFFIIEATTMGLATIWFAFGSIIALIAALLHLHFYIQISLFFICSIILLIFTRPLAQKYLKIGTAKTNLDSLLEKTGIVTENIEEFKMGQVKINGQIWSAIAQNEEKILKGSKVKIINIQGVKLIVKKLI